MKARYFIYCLLFVFPTREKIQAQANSYADSLERILKTESKTVPRIKILNNLGFEYAQDSEQKALNYTIEAIELAEKNNLADLKGIALSVQGAIYDINGKGLIAVKKYLEAAQVLESVKDLKELSTVYHNMAIVYSDRDEFETALKYYVKSYQIDSTLKDTLSACYAMNAIGVTLKNCNRYEEAETEFKKALTVVPGLQNYKLEAAVYSNYANLCVNHLNKPALAKDLIEHAFALLKDRKGKSLLADLYSIQASYWMQMHKPDSALASARRSLEISSVNRRKLLLILSDLYQQMGKTDSAFYYFKQHKTVTDSLTNLKKLRQLKELETIYDTEKNEKLILQQKLSLEKSKQRTVFFAMFLLLVSVITILTFLRYRSKNKTAILLKEKNKIIENALDQKELLMHEIHHRVKNNLQLISSILHLQSMNENSPAAEQTFREVNQRIKAISGMHNKLYQQEELTAIKTDEYVEELLNGIEKMYRNDINNCEIDVDVDPGIQLEIDDIIPLGLIINEVATNSFKYGVSDDGILYLSVNLHKVDDRFILQVKDKGKGLNTASANGFGTMLISSLSEKLNGKYEYANDNGLVFTLKFNPYKK